MELEDFLRLKFIEQICVAVAANKTTKMHSNNYGVLTTALVDSAWNAQNIPCTKRLQRVCEEFFSWQLSTKKVHKLPMMINLPEH